MRSWGARDKSLRTAETIESAYTKKIERVRTMSPRNVIARPPGYSDWLAGIKTRVAAARRRTVLMANGELMRLYWRIGRGILDWQASQGWCAKVIERPAGDLRDVLAEMKGFSRANLMYVRAFGQLPRSHNVVLVTHLREPASRLRYAEQASRDG